MQGVTTDARNELHVCAVVTKRPRLILGQTVLNLALQVGLKCL